jgi:hypothetical protein
MYRPADCTESLNSTQYRGSGKFQLTRLEDDDFVQGLVIIFVSFPQKDAQEFSFTGKFHDCPFH